MPNDPLALVNRGDPLEISAATANAWTEAARWVRRHRHDGGGGPLLDAVTAALQVIVRNDTGGDLDAHAVLRISDWVITPVDQPFLVADRPIVAGDTPDATTNQVVILREAIPDGEMGRAVLAGAAVVDVLVNDATHVWARPIAGDATRLESTTAGIARILAWETSGATRRAIVLLGDGASAGSGSFTLAGRTGTPQTISSGDTLTLNRGVASPTDTWTPDDVSATLPGDVSLSDQVLGDGTKTFRRGPVLNSTKSDYLTTAYGPLIDVDDDTYIDSSPGLYCADDETITGSTKWIGTRIAPPECGINHPNIEAYEQSGPTNNWVGLAFDPLATVGSGTGRVVLFSSETSIGTTGTYALLAGDQTTIYDGGTDVDEIGNTYKGGLFISKGSSGTFAEAVEDLVGGLLDDTATLSLTYNDGTPSVTGSVIYQMSVTADASGLKLSGDEASPTNGKFYGISGGTKGWYTPALGFTISDTNSVDLTMSVGYDLSAAVNVQKSITVPDASGLALVGDVASPGFDYFYGTDGGSGTKGWYAMPRCADVGALVDSTSGTAGLTLGPVSGTGDDAQINDNFASLLTQINAIRTELRNTTPPLMA